VIADARFAQKKFGDAETAYADLLKTLPSSSSQRKKAVEQLAASIYKQAESARDAGNLRAARKRFPARRPSHARRRYSRHG